MSTAGTAPGSLGWLGEAAWTAAATVRLPAVLRGRDPELRRLSGPTTWGTRQTHAPVVLVHGYALSSDCWGPLARELWTCDFDEVYALSYNAVTVDLVALADRLVAETDRLLEETGSEHVHLVGHSFGGLVVRLATECLGLHSRVGSVVTIATPHRGSPWARVAPGPNRRRMLPEACVLPEPVAVDELTPRYVNYYCRRDAIVARHSARLDSSLVENIEVRGAGHLGVTRAGQVIADLPGQLCAAEAERAARRAWRLLSVAPTPA